MKEILTLLLLANLYFASGQSSEFIYPEGTYITFVDRAVNVYHLRRMKVSSANQVHEIDSFWC